MIDQKDSIILLLVTVISFILFCVFSLPHCPPSMDLNQRIIDTLWVIGGIVFMVFNMSFTSFLLTQRREQASKNLKDRG